MLGFKTVVRWAMKTAAAVPPIRAALRAVGQAGLMPEAVSARLPVAATFDVALKDAGSFRYRCIVEDGVGRRLYWRGVEGWEPETVQVFLTLVRNARGFVDVGANTGVFSLLACVANPNVRVVAFEPVPVVYGRLVEHIRMNGLESRIEARPEAVSNRAGETKIYVPDHAAPTGASLHVGGLRGTGAVAIDVPLTTLDQTCADRMHVDLVKIDVEGFEDKVLEGMPGILADHRPTLIVEILPDGPYKAVQEILRRHGYRFFHLRVEGPMPMTEIVPDPTQRYENYLCTVHDDWRTVRSASAAHDSE
jgi:FkbM family methyltransferase